MLRHLLFLLAALIAPAVATADVLAELGREYPGAIDRVAVSRDTVTITGRVKGDATGLELADIPMDEARGRWDLRLPVTVEDGSFTLEVPRVRKRGERDHDRLVSRWQLVRGGGAETTPLSHPRHAEDVVTLHPDLPPVAPRSKKGLGGWNAGRIPGELEELGISAVTVNVMVHSLVSLEPEPDTEPFTWLGHTWHARRKVLEAYDATFREAAEKGVMVSAILLVANPSKTSEPVVKLIGHPDATPDGTYAMPNVSSPEGFAAYGALVKLMAERWSRPDGKFGRVNHWILHNEIDAGRVWTNAGDKSAPDYVDLFMKSLRLTDLVAREQDPGSRAFVSLTHHWTDRGDPAWYGSRQILELIERFTRAEGDLPWALAHHPYPQDLFNPRTWEDSHATFSFDTPKITPRNLEVLDAWMKRPEALYRGEVRPVHCTENGFNSRDYSPEALADQAAGMAIAWTKVQALDSIRIWHYHNWVDHPDEGGLRIGLRKFPTDPEDPQGKKPIWHLYRAFGTADEAATAAPFLSRTGLPSWEASLHREPVR